MSREEELVQVDRYLDALLASRYEIHEVAEPGVDDDLRTAAVAVQRALPRFHPSFAFEERLAQRLRTATQAKSATSGRLIAFLPRVPATTADGALSSGERETVSSAGLRPVALRPSLATVGLQPRRAGVLLGSAIASGVSIAGVSIAGAAFLARRRGKSTATAL